MQSVCIVKVMPMTENNVMADDTFYNMPRYIFEISVEILPNGKFRPVIELREENRGQTLFHNYTINETFETLDLAFENARRHAVSEARNNGLLEEEYKVIKHEFIPI